MSGKLTFWSMIATGAVMGEVSRVSHVLVVVVLVAYIYWAAVMESRPGKVEK